MSYQVKLSPQVLKFLDKLDDYLKNRIKNKFKKLKEGPFKYLESYKQDDFFKIRSGSYRAIIDVNIKEKIILVRYLNHRSKIYKRFR